MSAAETAGFPVFYGAILAGGLSSRMGCDKRFLKLGDESLVDRAIRLMSGVVGAPERVYLCGSVPARKSIPDSVPDLGPLGGVFSGLQRVRSDFPSDSSPAWLLVIPVDMPLLTADALLPLILTVTERRARLERVVAYHGFEMPFALCCDSYADNAIFNALQSRSPSLRSVRSLQDFIGTHHLILKDTAQELMLNTNSPKEWKRIQARRLA